MAIDAATDSRFGVKQNWWIDDGVGFNSSRPVAAEKAESHTKANRPAKYGYLDLKGKTGIIISSQKKTILFVFLVSKGGNFLHYSCQWCEFKFNPLRSGMHRLPQICGCNPKGEKIKMAAVFIQFVKEIRYRYRKQLSGFSQ